MKKKQFSRRLQLNKVTVSNLESDEMKRAKGGHSELCTDADTCTLWYSICIPICTEKVSKCIPCEQTNDCFTDFC